MPPWVESRLKPVVSAMGGKWILYAQLDQACASNVSFQSVPASEASGNRQPSWGSSSAMTVVALPVLPARSEFGVTITTLPGLRTVPTS